MVSEGVMTSCWALKHYLLPGDRFGISIVKSLTVDSSKMHNTTAYCAEFLQTREQLREHTGLESGCLFSSALDS